MALGDLTPAQAIACVREALADAAVDHGEIFDALRAYAWKTFAERIMGEEMTPRHDLFRRVSSLFEHAGDLERANKLAAYADLAIESVRFGRLHALGDVCARAHVRDILQVLKTHGNTALRTVVLAETGLKQANLSRVLAHMASSGLISRQTDGKNVTLTLTSLGREAITSPRSPGGNALIVFPPLATRQSVSDR